MGYKTSTEKFTVDGVTYRKITNTKSGAVCYHKQHEDEIMGVSISADEYFKMKDTSEEVQATILEEV